MTATTSRKATLTIEGHTVQVSSLDKVMYPEAEFTKQQVIDYYTAVADVLLPQLRDRVATRIRYPDGTGDGRFFERHLPARAPEWIRRVTISASPGTGKPAKRVTYPVIDDLASLVWMANQAALELHTPQWHVGPRGGIGKPDRLVIDLDPGEGTGLDECARVAHIAAARLADDGLTTIPLTSGSKGIHLYAAVDGKRTSLAVHAYVEKIARSLAADHPDLIVAASNKEERIGKVFIDWSQNHPARSTATPYTLRGRLQPTVAAPRTWDEIADGLAQLAPDEVLARLQSEGDLLAKR